QRLLIVIITDSGRVEQRAVELDATLDPAVVAELRARLNAGSIGRRIADIGTSLEDTTRLFAPEHRTLVATVVEVPTETLRLDAEERIVLAGTANLARADLDFSRTIGPVLEALEEQVVLLRLLHEMAED